MSLKMVKKWMGPYVSFLGEQKLPNTRLPMSVVKLSFQNAENTIKKTVELSILL